MKKVESSISRPPLPGTMKRIFYDAYLNGIPFKDALNESKLDSVRAHGAVSRLIASGNVLQSQREDMFLWVYGHTSEVATESIQIGEIPTKNLHDSELHKARNARVLPLILRRFGYDEIAMITGFDRIQIMNAAYTFRAQGIIRRQTPEEININKIQLAKVKRHRSGEVVIFSDDDEVDFTYAKALLEKKIMGVDLTDWYELHRASRESGIALPSLFASRLITEAKVKAYNSEDRRFLARLQAIEKEAKIEAESQIDTRKVSAAIAATQEAQTLCDGIDPQGTYFLDEKGRKWRRLGEFSTGIYETPEQLGSRFETRQRVASSKPEPTKNPSPEDLSA